ncbi:MAG: 50S ribosomal protein L6 [Promethearchaeota archaeon]
MVKNFLSEEVLEIPDNVDIKLDGKKFTIKGPKGVIHKDFSHAKQVEIEIKNNKIYFRAFFARKRTAASLGTLKSIIKNAIDGVTKGYTYRMMIAYSHFPIKLEPPKTKNGHDEIKILNFYHEDAPRITYTAGPGITIKATKEEVIVSGIDKELVGQTCANIQKRCRIRKKDSRKFQDGIYVYSKEFSTGEVFWSIK